MTSSATVAARALFDRQQHGVLCTAHAGMAGWPFGSVTPYAVLDTGDAVVFLSDIAEHTKNLARDARASLFVADPAAQARPQAGARLSVLVRARPAGVPERAAAENGYFTRFPQAQAMRDAHGFQTWILEVDCARWIAGFGEMGWISRAEWTGVTDPLAPHAAAIAAHLNADHAAAVLELVRGVSGCPATSANVIGLDRGGLLTEVKVAGGSKDTVRVPFAGTAQTAAEVRTLVVRMLAELRHRASP